MTDKISAIFAAADDVETHVDAWINLLRAHVASLPADLPETAHEQGVADKSYAAHELRAMERDLPALMAAIRNAALSTPVEAPQADRSAMTTMEKIAADIRDGIFPRRSEG